MVKELPVNTSVDELVSGCIDNNELSHTEFYKKFYKTVFETSYRYINNKEEAEDISQEVFIKLLTNLHKFNGKDEKQLYKWIKMVSRNMTIDIIRAKKYTMVEYDQNTIKGSTECIDVDLIDVEDTLDIDMATAIESLSPQYKKVIELYYLKDYTHEQIAIELNLNVGTSKSNLFRAKKKLATALIKYNKKLN